jgi:hypothetical protein
MYAQLAPDSEGETTLDCGQTPSDALRASPLVDQQKVRLEAFSSGTGSQLDAADYHSDALGRLILDDPDQPLEVNAGTYDFVAYSYYKSTSNLTTSNIDPRDYDLIWDKVSKEITATEAGRTVSITMGHLFAKVRVRVRTRAISNAQITFMDGVEIEGGKKANLSVWDGSLSDGSAVTQEVDDWPGVTFPDDEVDSGYYTFYPSPTRIRIGELRIEVDEVEYSFQDLFADFSQALEGGHSYTLVVDLKGTPWATSNVYWDGTAQRLTFDTSPNANPMRQGVMFKWGSLVGVSPVGTWVDYSTPIYKPTGTTPVTFTKTTAASFTAIPVLDIGSASISGYYVPNYVSDNTVDDPVAGTGDICRYIGVVDPTRAGYRLPNYDDCHFPYEELLEMWWYDKLYLYGDPWTKLAGSSWQEVSTTNDDGTSILTSGMCMDGATFPASGGRGVTPAGVGSYGAYDTGSVVREWDLNLGLSLTFSTYGLFPGNGVESGDSMLSVRCIRDE